MDLTQLETESASIVAEYLVRAADALASGNFEGGPHLGTLETGEVDLAPFYELEAIIPAQVKADLEQIKADIIAGKIQTKPDGQ